jgi:uncharacterized protein
MPPFRRTRREVLKVMGASAAATVLPAAYAARIDAAAIAHDTFEPMRAQFFSLADVRLAAGPFLDAQRRDEAYLLRLEPDRMLANFRKNAGLTPKAPVYGGWESVEPWVWIRCHGHTLGHYLGAAACMYQTTGDERFAQRVDYIVTELAECQEKTGGWLTAFPDGVAPLLDSLAGKEFAGVPWYTTHKVMAGLRDAHLYRGSPTALDVWKKFSEWTMEATKDVPEDRFQKMLDREHGGMSEVLADLFAITGDRRYFDLAGRFVHRAVYQPLSRGEDRLDGLHANTQIPKIIGLQRLYEVNGPPEFHAAARNFWEAVVETRSFATGGHGDGEHFFPKHEFAAHLGSAKTMETCCTHNMLRLTRSLYATNAIVEYMDYFERALFNGILASQDPDSGMMTYFQSTRPGYVKLFHTPFDSFWCCTGSGIENHARYAETIYAHDGDKLVVNLFLASTLNWSARGLRLEQATRFPDSDTTRLTFRTAGPRQLTLALRQPSWCPVMTVTINGRERRSCRQPGNYAELQREFRDGDVVEVRLPMSLRLEPLPGTSPNAPGECAALMYGPIVLAGIVGKPVDPAAQLIVNERKSGEMLNEPVAIPAWRRPLADLPGRLKRSDRQRLSFTAAGFDGGPVEFIPWFRIAHERYNLYWRRSG